MITRTNLSSGLINQGVSSLIGAGELFTTGQVWYVDSVRGSDGNNGKDPAFPFATIGAAQTAAVANRGDIVIIKPGYTETRTTVLTLSKAGVTYIGLGAGSLRPTITVNFAGDGISITGANIAISNIAFAAPGTDEATAMINVAAANVKLINIAGIGSTTSKNFVDCITIAAGADDLTIDGLEIYNTVVAVNSFVSIEAAVARFKMFNAFLFGDVATAGVIDAATATQMHWNNVTIGVVGTSKPAIVLDSNPTGLVEFGRFSGTSTTLASNANYGNALRLFEVRVLEETNASAQGGIIPAQDSD